MRMHSADYAIARCLSLRPSHASIMSKRLNISPNFFTVKIQALQRNVSSDINRLKAAFYYSSQLAANLVFDQVYSQVFDKFVWVCDTLSTSFRLFCRKPGREPQQVRWFMRVLDKLNVAKNRFKQVRSWLSTCFRPVCDQVFDQVCSWLE